MLGTTSWLPRQPTPTPAYACSFVERYATVHGHLTRAIERAQADGAEPPSLDADAAATVMVAAADGLQTQWLLDPAVDMAGHLVALWGWLTSRSPATPSPELALEDHVHHQHRHDGDDHGGEQRTEVDRVARL